MRGFFFSRARISFALVDEVPSHSLTIHLLLLLTRLLLLLLQCHHPLLWTSTTPLPTRRC